MKRREVARITALYRYPVKSMRGESIDSVDVGWHGLAGDRRLAFVRRGATGGFPWLTASKLPNLIAYQPLRRDGDPSDALPSAVRTPDGRVLDLRGDELCDELTAAHGQPVHLVQVDNGIFDDASVSIIGSGTVAAVAHGAESDPDARRFRPNVVVDLSRAFGEDAWIGKTVRFGEGDDAPALIIAQHDVRCMMINLDPETAANDPRMLKSAVRLNKNCAGVYAMVTRPGRIAVGERLYVE